MLPALAEVGITSAWLPPGCKANDPKGNGYDCYDLWDLGEFDQKWSRATKWGSRKELDEMMAKAKSVGVAVIWDAILNHKTAGDGTEECWAVEVDPGGTSYICFWAYTKLSTAFSEVWGLNINFYNQIAESRLRDRRRLSHGSNTTFRAGEIPTAASSGDGNISAELTGTNAARNMPFSRLSIRLRLHLDLAFPQTPADGEKGGQRTSTLKRGMRIT